MDLDATPYRSFVTVAEERSFTRAAARMNLSQPALSAQIRELERRLGFPLLARTSRTVELTVEGRLFLGNARRIVAETNWINNAAQEIRENQLRIGAPLYTALIPERQQLIDRLIVSRPDIRLRIFNEGNEKLYADLTRGKIDLAILLEPSETAACGTDALAEADWPRGFQRLTLGERPLALLVPAEHPLARWQCIEREALAGEKIAVINRSHGVALSVAVSRALNEAGAEPLRPPEGNALAVERYGGLTRIPAITLGWLGHPGGVHRHDMVRRSLDGFDVRTRLTLVRPPGPQRPAGAAVWSAVEAMREHFPHD